MARLLLATLISILAAPAIAQTIIGQASIIDGDTLEIHGTRIRLSGIDAPESDQLCRGDDSLQYHCGAKAANELDAHIAGRPVSCEGVGRDQYGRVVAVCSVDAVDLGEWLVRAGLAFDWPRYSRGKYAGAQKEAERAGRVYGREVTLCRGLIGLAFGMAGGLADVRTMPRRGNVIYKMA
jgi:endonuclease YncB( thermonuclease family)